MNESVCTVKQKISGGVPYYYVVGMVGKTKVIFASAQNNHFYWYLSKGLAEQDAAEIIAGTATKFRVSPIPYGLTFDDTEHKETEEISNE